MPFHFAGLLMPLPLLLLLLLLLLAQFPSHFRLFFFLCPAKLRKTYKNRSYSEQQQSGFWDFEEGQSKSTQTVRVIPLDFRKGYWPHKGKNAQHRRRCGGGQKQATASTKEMNCSEDPPRLRLRLRPTSPSTSTRSSVFSHRLTQWSINRLSTIQMQTIDYSDKAEEPFVSDSSCSCPGSLHSLAPAPPSLPGSNESSCAIHRDLKK